jgi:hypothetical protein
MGTVAMAEKGIVDYDPRSMCDGLPARSRSGAARPRIRRGRPVIEPDLDLNRCQHVGRLEQQVTRVMRVSGFTRGIHHRSSSSVDDAVRVGDPRAESVEPMLSRIATRLSATSPARKAGIGDGVIRSAIAPGW